MKCIAALVAALGTMNVVVLLAVFAIGLSFKIRGAAEEAAIAGKGVGWDTLVRFLEGGKSYQLVTNMVPTYPKMTEIKDGADAEAKALADWVTNNRASAEFYLRPTLVPYDILFLLVLGGFLALASVLVAKSLNAPPWLLGMLLVLPLLYVVADLVEDAMLVRFLCSADNITADLVGFVQKVTWLKRTTVGGAFFQTAAVALFAIGQDLCRVMPQA